MKKVIIFIGLKVLEVSAIVFGPYLLGSLLVQWPWYYKALQCTGESRWLIGLWFIFMLVAFIIIIGLLTVAVAANWEWAKKIANR